MRVLDLVYEYDADVGLYEVSFEQCSLFSFQIQNGGWDIDLRLGLLFHNFWILSSLLLSEKNMLTFVILVFDHHVKSAVFLPQTCGTIFSLLWFHSLLFDGCRSWYQPFTTTSA